MMYADLVDFVNKIFPIFMAILCFILWSMKKQFASKQEVNKIKLELEKKLDRQEAEKQMEEIMNKMHEIDISMMELKVTSKQTTETLKEIKETLKNKQNG